MGAATEGGADGDKSGCAVTKERTRRQGRWVAVEARAWWQGEWTAGPAGSGKERTAGQQWWDRCGRDTEKTAGAVKIVA